MLYVGRWHDAGTYDAKSRTGGPNGSIRNEQELNHAANRGLKTAVELMGEWCGLSFSFSSTEINTVLHCMNNQPYVILILFLLDNRKSEGQTPKSFICRPLSGYLIS